MEQLEFALVPIGIVLGYGVTKVLGSWAHVIRIWHGLERPPWLFLSSTGLSLLFMYANFSGLWAYRSVEYEVAQGIFNVLYLLVITLPILLFMLSVSVLVPPNLDEISNLEAHYVESALPFYLILASGVGASLLPDLLPGVKFAPSPLVIFIIIAVFLSLAWIKNRGIHLSVHAVLWMLVMARIVFIGLNNA